MECRNQCLEGKTIKCTMIKIKFNQLGGLKCKLFITLYGLCRCAFYGSSHAPTCRHASDISSGIIELRCPGKVDTLSQLAWVDSEDARYRVDGGRGCKSTHAYGC